MATKAQRAKRQLRQIEAILSRLETLHADFTSLQAVMYKVLGRHHNAVALTPGVAALLHQIEVEVESWVEYYEHEATQAEKREATQAEK